MADRIDWPTVIRRGALLVLIWVVCAAAAAVLLAAALLSCSRWIISGGRAD